MRNAILPMLISVLSISLSGFFAKISIENASVYSTVLSRFLVPFFLITCYAAIDSSNLITLSLSTFKGNIIRALALITSQLSLYLSLKGLSLAEATLLYNTGPIFIVIFSILNGYRLTISSITSLVLGTIGIIFTFGTNAVIMNQYVMYGLLSGAAFAISQLSLHNATKNNGILNIMFHLYGLTTVISLFVFFLSGSHISDIMKINIHTALILFLIGLTSFSNQLFRGLSYRRCSNPTKLAPLLYLSIPLSALFDTLYYEKRIDSSSIVGMALILVASFIASSSASKNSVQRNSPSKQSYRHTLNVKSGIFKVAS